MKETTQHTRWVLSGSSMTRLFKNGQRIPVGRISRYKINPFSFVDFLRVHEKENLIEQIVGFDPNKSISTYMHSELLKQADNYLKIGGLPEVVLAHKQEFSHQDRLQQIYITQEDDFIRKTGLEKRALYKKAIAAVANHLGSQSNLSHLDASYREARLIYANLERWHLVNTIELKGVSTTTNFHPKRYVYDLGIAQLLRNHPFPQISIIDTIDPILKTPLGGLFENLVLLSLQGLNVDNFNISGWKKNSKEQVEVDFVLRYQDNIIPIECKASLSVPKNLTSLIVFMEQSGLQKGFVISGAPFAILSKNGMKLFNLPIYLARLNIIHALMND